MSILNLLCGRKISEMNVAPAVGKIYRSQNGQAYFKFRFTPEGDHIAIFCLAHPPLNGRDPNPHKTHLFSSGQVCLMPGREPKDQSRAEELARQWAEYFLEYRRTGVVQQ